MHPPTSLLASMRVTLYFLSLPCLLPLPGLNKLHKTLLAATPLCSPPPSVSWSPLPPPVVFSTPFFTSLLQLILHLCVSPPLSALYLLISSHCGGARSRVCTERENVAQVTERKPEDAEWGRRMLKGAGWGGGMEGGCSGKRKGRSGNASPVVNRFIYLSIPGHLLLSHLFRATLCCFLVY